MPDIRVRHQQELLWLILDRPPFNVLTPEMLKQLAQAIRTALAQAPRLIIVTGAGEQAFCTGGDETRLTALRRESVGVIDALEEAQSKGISTVALIKGEARGAGCELGWLCDTVIVREDAHFEIPPLEKHVFVDAFLAHLSSVVGAQKAEQLVRQEKQLSAREAMRLGMVHQVLPAGRFVQDTEELLIMLAMVG